MMGADKAAKKATTVVAVVAYVDEGPTVVAIVAYVEEGTTVVAVMAYVEEGTTIVAVLAYVVLLAGTVVVSGKGTTIVAVLAYVVLLAGTVVVSGKGSGREEPVVLKSTPCPLTLHMSEVTVVTCAATEGGDTVCWSVMPDTVRDER
jgi:hypothetical protein